MKVMMGVRLLGLAVVVPLVVGCWDNMTYREALEAVEEAAISGKGDALTQEIIEISTDFTMGEAVAVAAQELHDALVSQIPCSEVSLDEGTVTVDFGVLGDACEYNGHTYAGLWAVTIESNDEQAVQVGHAWTGLTNGDVTLDGTAVVTWSGADSSRRVVHDVVWSDPERSIEASGDRTQAMIEPGDLSAGIVVDGERDWSGENGDWMLDIEGVEMRGQDPVPQAGLYTLTTPEAKVVTLSFVRLDGDTIECTLTAPNRAWVFEVSSAGEVD